MSCCKPCRIASPALGQVQGSIDKGMAANGHIGGEHTDLAVRYLASRTCILTCNTARCLALLEKARLVDDQDRIICGEVFDNILSHDVAKSVRVPTPATQNGLLPPRAGITGRLSPHPTCLTPLVTQQAVQEKSSQMLQLAPA